MVRIDVMERNTNVLNRTPSIWWGGRHVTCTYYFFRITVGAVRRDPENGREWSHATDCGPIVRMMPGPAIEPSKDKLQAIIRRIWCTWQATSWCKLWMCSLAIIVWYCTDWRFDRTIKIPRKIRESGHTIYCKSWIRSWNEVEGKDAEQRWEWAARMHYNFIIKM